MTIVKEWCDGRKENISFKDAVRYLIDTYGTSSEIHELLSNGETLYTCTATYYEHHFCADKRIGDPRVKQRRVKYE